MTSKVHGFGAPNHAVIRGPFLSSDADQDSSVQAKLVEIQTWTICYNRELLRLTRELNELRSKKAQAA